MAQLGLAVTRSEPDRRATLPGRLHHHTRCYETTAWHLAAQQIRSAARPLTTVGCLNPHVGTRTSPLTARRGWRGMGERRAGGRPGDRPRVRRCSAGRIGHAQARPLLRRRRIAGVCQLLDARTLHEDSGARHCKVAQVGSGLPFRRQQSGDAMPSPREQRTQSTDGAAEDRRSCGAAATPSREICSGLFPLGLPDRSDETVLEAFSNAWLLLLRASGEVQVVGMAQNYESARAWLDEAEPGDRIRSWTAGPRLY